MKKMQRETHKEATRATCSMPKYDFIHRIIILFFNNVDFVILVVVVAVVAPGM